MNAISTDAGIADPTVASATCHGLVPDSRPATKSAIGWSDRLLGFSSLSSSWDSYGAEAPSGDCLQAAARFLKAIEGSQIPLAKLNPSVVGGVGFTFRSGMRSAYVEFRNTGNAHAAFIDGVCEPAVIRVVQDRAGFAAILTKVENYLHEQAAVGHENERS